MRFIQFLKFMFFITAVALAYIHMQMQIIDLAYQGKIKEKEITKLSEHKQFLTYNILRLKSSAHLGVKMLAEDSNMQFADPNDVIEISTAQFTPEAEISLAEADEAKNSNLLLSLLSIATKAEAKGR